jgi:hypothetical protein
LSGEASGQVKLPDKRIDTRKQAPNIGSLPRSITIPPRLAEVTNGNHPVPEPALFGNQTGNLVLIDRGAT